MVKKRPPIAWNNHIMRKHGGSIKKKIFEAHTPFLKIMTARKIVEKRKLLCREAESKSMQ